MLEIYQNWDTHFKLKDFYINLVLSTVMDFKSFVTAEVIKEAQK